MDMATKNKLTKREKHQHNKGETQIRTSTKNLIPLLTIIIGVFAFFVYSNTFKHGYVLDDFSVIRENWVVKKGTEGIPTILKTNYRYGYWNSQGTLYRPIPLILFALEWEYFPDNPGVAHIINVLLYTLLCMVLFLTLKRILNGFTIAVPFIAALIFAIHPVHTEVVANIKSADEILSMLFVLLSLLWLWKYLTSNKLTQLLISLVLFFLSFASKEGTVTFLFLIPIMIFFFTETSLKKNILISLSFVIPAAIFLFIRYRVLGAADISDMISVADNSLKAAPDWISQKATAILILGKYLLLLIFPYPLSSDYSFNQIPNVSLLNIWALLSTILHAALLIYAVITIKKKGLFSFSILFYLISMALYSNLFILIGSNMGERFLFVGSLGFTIALAYGLLKILRMDTTFTHYGSVSDFFKKTGKALAIVAVLVVAGSWVSLDRNKAWESNYTLYSTDVKTSTNSSHMHYHYGLTTMKDKSIDEAGNVIAPAYLDTAIAEFKKAIEIYPSYADVYEQLGLAYFRKNQTDSSIYYYEEALKLHPGKARTYSNMGIIYFNKKEFGKALEVYKTAVQLDPHFADGYMNLGSTYGTLGKPREAIKSFLKCLEYDPQNAQANFFLAMTYKNVGEMANAQKYFDIAYKLNPALKPAE